jgi:hypothetical protein
MSQAQVMEAAANVPPTPHAKLQGVWLYLTILTTFTGFVSGITRTKPPRAPREQDARLPLTACLIASLQSCGRRGPQRARSTGSACITNRITAPLSPRRTAAVRAPHGTRVITQRDMAAISEQPASYGMARE